MTPEKFITRWFNNPLSERAGAQPYIRDLCDVLGVEHPVYLGEYQFEFGASKVSGGDGWADVWKRGCFGWENKKPGRDLNAALKQLMDYSPALGYPPLLVVCDRLRIEIHTAFNGYPDEPKTIRLEDIGKPENLQTLRWVFNEPERLRPAKSSAAITEDVARRFAAISASMETRGIPQPQSAHFLMQCLFCMFSEDERLLPEMIFTKLLEKAKSDPERAKGRMEALFATMKKGGDYGDDVIAWFNGGLFKHIDIPTLEPAEVAALTTAARDTDWRAIEPAIFGTLFERGLLDSKRSQLGAHYTDPGTIMRIIDPVIVAPLSNEWEAAKLHINAAVAKSKKKGDKSYRVAEANFHGFLDRLRNFRVLDPACGSGNFLYLALKSMKDLEKKANLEAEMLGLQRQVSIEVSPANVLGIELDAYAAELARVTVWIGEIQWMLKNGYPLNKNPILKPLDHIENRDALLNDDGTEASWPNADAVVGNPPFLGAKFHSSQLGSPYMAMLRRTYSERVPGLADLVCYWFAKAGDQVQSGAAQYVGLVATNSIRDGKSALVLRSLGESTHLFNAWSDEKWINDGAAVRVSIVCFGKKNDGFPISQPVLDGKAVASISFDLSGDSAVGFSVAPSRLIENAGVSFIGTQKNGPFEVDAAIARSWLSIVNEHGRRNSDVVRPWINALGLVRRPADLWMVDFGTKMSELDASYFAEPFEHVRVHVKPLREAIRRKAEENIGGALERRCRLYEKP